MDNKRLIVLAAILVVITPIGLGYIFAVEDVEKTDYVAGDSVNISENYYNSYRTYAYKVGAYENNNTTLYGVGALPDYVNTGTTVTPIPIYSNGSLTTTTGTGDGSTANTLSTSGCRYITFTVEPNAVYTVTTKSGQTMTVSHPDSFYYSNGVVVYSLIPNVFSIANVVSISYVYGNGINYSITTMGAAASGIYANLSSGWMLPTTSETSGTWINGYENIGAVVTVAMPRNSTASLTPWFYASGVGLDTLISLASVEGVVSVNGVELGAYSFIQINFDAVNGVARVTGLLEYPTIGTLANGVNYIDVPMGAVSFYGINLTASARVSGISAPYFRVEYTNSAAGYYPIMEDAAINTASLWPSQAASVITLSNAVFSDQYGLSLTWAGVTYEVGGDGRQINVGGYWLNVEGLAFKTIKQDSGEYMSYIGSEYINTTSSQPSLVLNGKWDTTTSAALCTLNTSIVREWQPGQFAWEVGGQSFAVAGLLGSVGVFVALSIAGRRSGAKCGWLMAICGFAGLMFFLMI